MRFDSRVDRSAPDASVAPVTANAPISTPRTVDTRMAIPSAAGRVTSLSGAVYSAPMRARVTTGSLLRYVPLLLTSAIVATSSAGPLARDDRSSTLWDTGTFSILGYDPDTGEVGG